MNPSRRDVLAALLGGSAALQACSLLSKERPPLEGEIVGAAAAFGHRLRDERLRAGPSARWHRARVVIVGGGVAGLSAAWRLRSAGFSDFRILDLEPVTGGTARGGRNDVSAFPWGAHYLPLPLPESHALLTLLQDMGIVTGLDAEGRPLVDEATFVRSPEERLFRYGQWFEGLFPLAGASDADLAQWDRFSSLIDSWIRWRDAGGRRAFTIPVSACSDDAEVTALDRISMADWLRSKGFDSSRLLWYVDYACRDDYGTSLEGTSAWAGIFYFASRVPEPGAESTPLMAWPEGNAHLVAWLSALNRSAIRTRTLVTGVEPGSDDDGRPRVDVHCLSEETNTLFGIHAERAILATPVFLNRYLVDPWRDAPPRWIAGFEHSPWLVANLTLRDRPAEFSFPMAWDNVLYESPSLGYVNAVHQTFRDYGATVLTYYYPFTGDDVIQQRRRLFEASWHDWVDVIRSDLGRAHRDLDALLTRVDIMKWGHAMIRPVPGLIWGGARRQAAAPFRGIHFAHTDLSGVALFEEAFDHGVRAAEEVMASLGHPFHPLRR